MNIKKIISILLVISLLLLPCYSIATTSYVWSSASSDLIETVSDTETDLKLESRWCNFD